MSVVKDILFVKPVCTKCIELQKKIDKDGQNLKQIEDEVDKICKVLKTGGDFRKFKPSIWQKLELFLGKQEQNDEDVFIKLTRILSYIETMHKALGEQEITLDERIKEVVVLKRVNSNLKGQTEKLKGGLTNKSREVKDIEDCYTKREESLFYKYKEDINAMNETIRSLKIDFKEKCDQNIKLQEEIKVLREATKVRILELENIKNQLEKRLESTAENLNIAQNNLKEETKLKSQLEKNLQSTIKDLNMAQSQNYSLKTRIQKLLGDATLMNSTPEEESNRNKVLQEEIKVLKQTSTIKILELENLKKQFEVDWKLTAKDLDTAQNNLKQETSVKQRLQRKLEELKELIFANAVDLIKKKEMFQCDLSKVLKVTEPFRNKISINDIELEMEIQFITKTNKIIDNIMEDMETYEKEINAFSGNCKSEKYMNIKGMLTKTLTELNAIDSQNNDRIQIRRKSCISYVKDLQSKLNDKPKLNTD